jgi:hypothetical protein
VEQQPKEHSYFFMGWICGEKNVGNMRKERAFFCLWVYNIDVGR